MRFLRSKYVLFLLLAVLAVELLFRLGLYEPVVSPYSHSGTTVTVKRTLQKFGKDAVQAVTFGDSRAAQGLDNRRIYKAGEAQGLNHLKLSMPGSHFLTIKAMASWSVDELEGLQGIVIAFSPAAFASTGNGAYEVANVMPLRGDISAREIFHHVPFSRSDVRTYAPLFTLAGYREDVRDLLADPAARFEAVQKRNVRSVMNILTFTAEEPDDICGVPLDDAQACMDALQDTNLVLSDRARSTLSNMCRAGLKERRQAGPGPEMPALAGEWVDFLVGLSSEVRVMLVILPELSAYRRYAYSPNAIYNTEIIVGRLREGGKVEVVDLSGVFARQGRPECGYFLDALHLNNPGKQVVTDALLPRLEAFWQGFEAGD